MQEAGLTAAMLAAAEGGDATVSMGGKEVDTAAAVAALLEGGAVKAAKKQKRWRELERNKWMDNKWMGVSNRESGVRVLWKEGVFVDSLCNHFNKFYVYS